MKKTTKILILLLLASQSLTGCKSSRESKTDIKLHTPEYEKKVHESVQIQKGTISPILNLTLKLDEYEVTNYTLMKDELLVEELNVEKGDYVNTGDVMVVFKNDGLKEEIESYEQRLEEDKLLLEHYNNLKEIDKDQDYTASINEVNDDIEVVNAYLAENRAKLEDYQVVAKKSGVVTDIAEDLYKGYGRKGNSLVKVTSGSSNYITKTSDEYEFIVGGEYEATLGVATYKMELLSITEASGGRELLFKPLSDMSSVAGTDTLFMEIHKTPIENAVYVEQAAIVTVGDKTYVYKLDENGYRHAAEVVVDYIIEGYAIISDGVSEGEWVTLE